MTLDELLAAVAALPTVRTSETDGEEADGTPRSWRDRPYVSRTKLERLLREHWPPGVQEVPVAEQFLIDEDDYAAIQNAVQTLEAIAQRQRQICDLIEPVNDIRRAAGLAKYAHSRLEPVLFKLRRSDGVPAGGGGQKG